MAPKTRRNTQKPTETIEYTRTSDWSKDAWAGYIKDIKEKGLVDRPRVMRMFKRITVSLVPSGCARTE